MRAKSFVCVVTSAALAAALSGCGGGDDGDGLATLEGGSTVQEGSGDAELDAEQSILALTECMRQEGVDVPDPEFDDAGNLRLQSLASIGEATATIDPDELEAAAEACREYMVGVAQVFQSIDRTAIEDRLFELASCMRDNGFDMPDPDFTISVGGTDAGGPGDPFGEIDVEDPAFEAAFEACRWVFGETIGTGGFGPPVEPGG
jgi:hypothetical protein